MPFPFWMARRMRLNASSTTSNATGVIIAVAGVALAIIIMEFTLAVVTGFKHQITRRVMGFEGQVWVTPDYDVEMGKQHPWFVADSILLASIDVVVPQASTEGRFTQPALLKTDTDFSGVYMVGYDHGHDNSFEKGFIKEGELPDFSLADNANKIVVSEYTASELALAPGDKLYTYFFVNDAVKTRRFEVAGIYETGFADFDKTIVYAPVSTLRKVADADSNALTQLSVLDVPVADIPVTAERLQQRLIDVYQFSDYDRLFPVDNVRHTGGIYFSWLDLLDTNVVVIFILMLCVAGFTLISSMFILILERINTIGILRALGATRRQIRLIFINVSMRVVGLGMIIGNVVAVTLLLVQQRFHVLPLDPQMYYLSTVPVEINWMHFLLLNIGVGVVTWLVLVLPSRLASGISPAVTMRFE